MCFYKVDFAKSMCLAAAGAVAVAAAKLLLCVLGVLAQL
jgi:hypothetical protein